MTLGSNAKGYTLMLEPTRFVSVKVRSSHCTDQLIVPVILPKTWAVDITNFRIPIALSKMLAALFILLGLNEIA